MQVREVDAARVCSAFGGVNAEAGDSLGFPDCNVAVDGRHSPLSDNLPSSAGYPMRATVILATLLLAIATTACTSGEEEADPTEETEATEEASGDEAEEEAPDEEAAEEEEEAPAEEAPPAEASGEAAPPAEASGEAAPPEEASGD